MIVKQVVASLALAFMALLSMGCCHVRAYDVTVELDDAMRQRLQSRNIEVHILAVNDKENERWQNYSMTKYWQPNDVMRESIPTYKMIFDPAKNAPQTLSSKDAIWAKWFASNASNLYVVALLPGLYDDAPGDKDPRRQILPLVSCRWKTDTIRLKVQQTGIVSITQPLPEP